jgi:hypothetical protein
MKATWNRIMQALKGRKSTRLDEAGSAGAAQDAGTPPSGATHRAPVNWAVLLPSARTVRWLATGAVVVAAGLVVMRNPPVQHLAQGELGVRLNQFTGDVSLWRDGSVWVVPGLHTVRVFSLRDQSYRPEAMRQANGSAPLQSVEGLSLGLDLNVRYALDPASPAVKAGNLPACAAKGTDGGDFQVCGHRRQRHQGAPGAPGKPGSARSQDRAARRHALSTATAWRRGFMRL